MKSDWEEDGGGIGRGRGWGGREERTNQEHVPNLLILGGDETEIFLSVSAK
jgi:hypothetical protein